MRRTLLLWIGLCLMLTIFPGSAVANNEDPKDLIKLNVHMPFYGALYVDVCVLYKEWEAGEEREIFKQTYYLAGGSQFASVDFTIPTGYSHGLRKKSRETRQRTVFRVRDWSISRPIERYEMDLNEETLRAFPRDKDGTIMISITDDMLKFKDKQPS